jgi:hypothetical protein
MNKKLYGIIKGVFIVFLVFITIMVVHSQDFQANARLDTTSLLIGDQTNLSMNFKFPAKTQVQWPLIKDTILGYIQVLYRSKIDTTISKDNKWMTLHQTLKITSFDSGLYTIPPIRFYFRELPDTTLHFSQSEPLILSVHTIPVDTTKLIKPIKGPMKVPLTFREILPWIILAIILAIIIWFVIYYLKKRKKAEPIFQLKPKVILPPHEIALAELEKLRAKKLWQSGKIKEYHTEVTEIIRRYVEDRFSVPALESTSGEILDALSENTDISSKLLDKLFPILTLADLVKFAKAQPLPAENDQSLQYAIDFVKSTIAKSEEKTDDKSEG